MNGEQTGEIDSQICIDGHEDGSVITNKRKKKHIGNGDFWKSWFKGWDFYFVIGYKKFL